MAPRRILVAGLGNLFLSDDAFGVEVAQRLVQHSVPAGVEVVDIGIRGVHLVHQLMDGYDVLVLVDAVARGLEPGTVTLIEPRPATGGDADGPGWTALDAHGLDPGALLDQARRLGAEPGRTLLVACEPESVGDGIGLGPAVTAAVAPAVAGVLRLLDELTSEPAPGVRAGEGKW
jgi:hydrogenase maturation protease